MRSHLATLLTTIVAVLALGATPAAAVETGINETTYRSKPTAATAAALGAGWVRLWTTWESAEPIRGRIDGNVLRTTNEAVNEAKAHGLRVLMVVHRTPSWANGGHGARTPPTDPSTFGAVLGQLAARVPGVDAWELWNEEDESMFWAGGADPAKYAAMVKSAYPAIKRAQPGDVVVLGGTTGNNFDFLEALYRNGIKGSFDAVGVHTDNACNVNSPDVSYREPDGRVGRFSFTGYREVHAVMAAHGDGAKQIWMTELGWNTQSTAPHSCNIGSWKGTRPLGVSAARQAQFLTQAYRCLQADPYVGVALWFGMQDVPDAHSTAGYGLYRSDGSAKPAAAAFRALGAGIKPLSCGGVVDTSGPEIRISKPLDGAQFVDVLPIDAAAVDAAGGVGIRRIEIWADGHFARSFGDGHALMRSFWPVAHWRRGAHTLTFKAADEAGNKTSQTITVYKVRKLPKVRTAATLALEQPAPGTVHVTGAISLPVATAAAKLRGRAVLVFQKRGAEGWKTVRRIKRRAAAPIDVTQTLPAGEWRAFLRYPGRKRFKKSRSAPVTFTVAAA